MLEIEIVESNIIEGGIEVFARAWKDGVQIGFGKDGSIDIERFVVKNPPVLVPDVNGPIIRTSSHTDIITGEDIIREYRFREDPEEALLQNLEHTIGVIQKFDNSNIISGRRGNTTTTVYPDPSPETDSVDGVVLGSNSTWSTLRTQATGASAQTTEVAVGNFRCFLFSGIYYMERGFFTFDTSAIGSDTIDSATLSLYKQAGAVNGGSLLLNWCDASLDSVIDVTTSDWDSVTVNSPTQYSTEWDFTTGTNNSYFDRTLNASGEANINGSGVTQFSLRFNADYNNTTPGTGNSNINNGYALADTSGTTSDPKLVVEHTTPTVSNECKSVAGVSNV